MIQPIQPSQVYVVTAAYYSDEEPIRYLRRSCAHFCIDLHTYGRGKAFDSWRQAKMRDLADHLTTIDRTRYTHFLYTDGADTWFVRSLQAVVDAYDRLCGVSRGQVGVNPVPDPRDALGAPSGLVNHPTKRLVVSAERTCYPHGDLHIHFPTEESVGPWRFPNAGQFMGEVEFGIDLLRTLDADYGRYDQYNDQSAWSHWLAVHGQCGSVVIDHQCELFLSMASTDWFKGCPYPGFDGEGPYVAHRSYFETPSDGEKYKVWPLVRPCLIHFNGGGTKSEMLANEWQRLTGDKYQ